MKKLIALLVLVLTGISLALSASPDRKLEKVTDPTDPSDPGHFQCINDGDNCAVDTIRIR